MATLFCLLRFREWPLPKVTEIHTYSKSSEGNSYSVFGDTSGRLIVKYPGQDEAFIHTLTTQVVRFTNEGHIPFMCVVEEGHAAVFLDGKELLPFEEADGAIHETSPKGILEERRPDNYPQIIAAGFQHPDEFQFTKALVSLEARAFSLPYNQILPNAVLLNMLLLGENSLIDKANQLHAIELTYRPFDERLAFRSSESPAPALAIIDVWGSADEKFSPPTSKEGFLSCPVLMIDDMVITVQEAIIGACEIMLKEPPHDAGVVTSGSQAIVEFFKADNHSFAEVNPLHIILRSISLVVLDAMIPLVNAINMKY